MNVFNKTYLRLALVSVTFTFIFYFFCNIMVQYILDANMKLVCDVYYEQISSKVKSDISLLKSANEYLTKNEIIVDYLKNGNKNSKDTSLEKQKVANEIKSIEKILSTISFVDSINIVDLENKHLFSKVGEIENFDIATRSWYDEKFFKTHNDSSIITDGHIDYITEKETIAIVSLIYDDKDVSKYFSPIGAAVLDIYIDDLLNYIDSSFYTGVLKTEIYPKGTNFSDLKDDKDTYNIYINEEILDNGEYLVFKFDKSSLVNASTTKTSLQEMRRVLLFVGVTIAILLFVAIRISFKSALMSISKLKSILEKLNNNSYFVEDKNEFRQLEMLADTLNKSFDDKIQELIYYDELTKLPNRKMLENICNDLIEIDKQFALIFIDLNKFKYVNDVFGHNIGDEYLIKFSNIMKDLVSEKGTITRYSGDEFIIVYEDYTTNKELIQFYNEKIIKVFLNPIKINEELTIEIGFSAGVAIYPKDGKTFEELVKKSDFMMYVNKKSFINRKISFFNESMYEKLLYSEEVKKELKEALENDEFYLNYQPIIDKNCKILKAEALIRWDNKRLGFIPPDKFINYLEETRQIIKVGYWTIERVCKDIKELKIEKSNIQISVNISPLQLMLKDFVDNVINIVNKYNISYNLLCFEITESVLLDDRQFVVPNIKMLRDLGIKIALDDFGTGYSSFNYLRNYKLDILKIDKSFLGNNEKLDFDIINEIKQLSHLLNMEVVIEGVETKEQFNILGEIGIDYLQGYYFSKPIALEEFKKMLKG